MGVPALFRWLSTKYPKIITSVVEEEPRELDGEAIPVDYKKANPNGWENHNLYLDMNGIVHPCSHPEDRPAPATEEAMMFDIFEYTERVVNMVRPRRLLMIAVDGVAPRAKMNQQRSRRFRSAQEAKENDAAKAEFLKMLKSQEKEGPISEDAEAKMSEKTWDSNSITPGTPFMNLLAAALRYWVAYKLNTDEAWAKLKVIISDATVPGEGEHKIMEFVRSQRRSPDHDPNTNHVMYGLDADLIMLGLATHEPYFRVLREDVFAQDSLKRMCKLCGQAGHYADQCRGEPKPKPAEVEGKGQVATTKKPFIWLHVSILREYLAAELAVPNQGFQFDLERALDDWVFMCFFVGNDFLPHLPSLDIREDGIDTLIAIWRDNIPLMGGYVTKDGHVDLERAQYILAGLAKQEAAIFRRRKETEDRKAAAAKRREEQRAQRRGPRWQDQNGNSQRDTNNQKRNPHSAPEYGNEEFVPGEGWKSTATVLTHDMVVNRKSAIEQANVANKSAAAVLKERMRSPKDASAPAPEPDANGETPAVSVQENVKPASALGKRKADLIEEADSGTPGRTTPKPSGEAKKADEEPPPDMVQLWEDGYEERYYEQKFKVAPNDLEFRHSVARDYVEGLCWVLLYYMQGCTSWTWYYPHHYAPFGADFVDLAKMDIKFDIGKPFRPYEQLMGVMPAASRHTIPEAFHPLMLDEESDIIEFYPEEFLVDLNGKKFSWQGVALLPFIDEKRLLEAMATKYPLLTPDEVARNEPGREALLFSGQHPMFKDAEEKFYSKHQGAPKFKLDPKKSEFLIGKIEKNEDSLLYSALMSPMDRSLSGVGEDRSMSVFYEMPLSTNIHKSMLLSGVKLPKSVLDDADIQGTKNRAGRSGRSFGGVPFRQNSNGRSNGNRNNSINYSNPFGAHLNPNFDPNGHGRAPPPPHLAAQMGFPPPPPPTMQASGSYWTGAGYNTGGQGWGYRGPPPRPGPGGHDQSQAGYGGAAWDAHRDPRAVPPQGTDPRHGYNGDLLRGGPRGQWSDRHEQRYDRNRDQRHGSNQNHSHHGYNSTGNQGRQW